MTCSKLDFESRLTQVFSFALIAAKTSLFIIQMNIHNFIHPRTLIHNPQQGRHDRRVLLTPSYRSVRAIQFFKLWCHDLGASTRSCATRWRFRCFTALSKLQDRGTRFFQLEKLNSPDRSAPSIVEVAAPSAHAFYIIRNIT